jgi:pimeloyl-ACP methyl ester carboxylesterase
MDVPLSDGVRLHAEEYGDPDAPVTVLLLHGWTLDRHIWHRQVTGLPETGVPARIVVYDARGHGRSGPARRRTATLAQLGEDLAEVIRAVAPSGPVVLAGHSLGGMTIMEYADRHPDEFAQRVAGLVFVSTTAEGARHTSYGLPSALARAVRVAEVAGAGLLAYLGAYRPHRLLKIPLRPGLRWLLFGDPADPADIGLALTSVVGTSLGAIGGFRASIGAQQRLETLAALPAVPTAVLVGDRDRLTPRACSEAIAAAVPGAELTVCPGAGHMLTLERAAEVTTALARVTKTASAGQTT